jgi:hypothetical protein
MRWAVVVVVVARPYDAASSHFVVVVDHPDFCSEPSISLQLIQTRVGRGLLQCWVAKER